MDAKFSLTVRRSDHRTERLFMDDKFSLMSKDFRILGKRLLMDDKLNFIGRTLKTSFQDSSNKIKPLFSTRIKQSSR